MKKIETVSYICEYCDSKYVTEEEANACESIHIPIQQINKTYYEKEIKYPYGISVAFADGEVRFYKMVL